MARAIMLFTILAAIMLGCYYGGYILTMGWFDFLLQPSTVLTQPWYIIMTNALIALGNIGIIVGAIYYKSDIGINAGIATLLFTPMTQGCLSLWSTLAAYNGGAAKPLANIIFGLMLFLMIFTIYEWFRGKD